MPEALTVIERNNLAELEETIQKHLSAFYEVGFALMQIRDNRLYREAYTTFEAYCKEKWGFERNYANKLIRASEVVDNLGTVVPIPTSERSIRPLTIIKDPEEQREVYQKAVETAPEGKVTAQHVKNIVREHRGEAVKIEEPKEKESEALWNLKRWWRRATKKDKKRFTEWTKQQ